MRSRAAKSAANTSPASNIALLDRLEVGRAWRRHAGPEIHRVGFFSGETCVEAPMPGADIGTLKDDFGRALGREVLDAPAFQTVRSAGAEIFQPCRAVAIDRDGDMQAVPHSGEGCDFREHYLLRAPVIVAAHGSWEPGHATKPD